MKDKIAGSLYMKNLVFLIFSLLSLSACQSQKISTGKFTVKSTQYSVKTSKYTDDKLIAIFNQSGKYVNGIPYSQNPRALPVSKNDLHVDLKKAEAIVFSVLQGKLAALKLAGETMNITAVFEVDGDMSEVSYIQIKKNTIITMKEMDMIFKRFEKELNMTFTGIAYKDYPAFVYYFPTIKF